MAMTMKFYGVYPFNKIDKVFLMLRQTVYGSYVAFILKYTTQADVFYGGTNEVSVRKTG